METDDFVANQKNGKSPIDTLVVPGVGSTSLATASFARNVADTLGKPVAGIVPGFGAADLLADAFGGWFVLGANNALLETAAKVNAMGFRRSAGASEAAGGATFQGADFLGNYWPSPMGLLLNETNEVAVLQGLLSEENNLKLIIGHSKGCLALAFALNAVAVRNARKNARAAGLVGVGRQRCGASHSPLRAAATIRQSPKGQKKARLVAGLKLFSWRRIVETGEIMLRRRIYVQFCFQIPDIHEQHITVEPLFPKGIIP